MNCDELKVNEDQIFELLEKRRMLLCEVINQKRDEISKAPIGGLHASNHGKYKSYYRRELTEEGRIIEKYIPKKNIELVHALAQREYDEKLNEILLSSLDTLSNFERELIRLSPAKVGSLLPMAKSTLIKPIYNSDEEFVKEWQNVKYVGKGFGGVETEFFTSKNERVRSKSEIMIADSLNRYGVPYRYEYPVHLKGVGTVYPDFLCLNVRKRKEVIWEHFGMMTKDDYVSDSVIPKLRSYEKKGYRLGDDFIFTMESSVSALSSKYVNQMIEDYLT